MSRHTEHDEAQCIPRATAWVVLSLLSCGSGVSSEARTWADSDVTWQTYRRDVGRATLHRALRAGEVAATSDASAAVRERVRRIGRAMAAPPARWQAAPSDDPPEVALPNLVVRSAPPRPAAVATGRTASAVSEPITGRNRLFAVGLQRRDGGVDVRLSGAAPMVVGLAHQRDRGVVRLVVEADPEPAVLRARPRVAGAEVVSVRPLGHSVVVTVAVEPSWTVGGVSKTRSGAKVRLRPV